VTLVHGFNLAAILPIVFAFTIYATIVAGCIGFAVGESFQRTYSHNKWTDDPAVKPEILEGSNSRIIGDLIIRRSSKSGDQPYRFDLAEGAGT
jgi:hypothetical protein